MGGKGHAPSQHCSLGGLNHGGHLPLVVQYMQTSQMWISILCYGESTFHSACRFCLWKENLTCSKSLKLAVPIEFLVSLLCRLGPVCKTRTLNNQASILAVEEELYTQLHQSITSYETQTDSPNVCLLKQAHSQAKIISKVIHQPNPDSLTQTTMSANTDGAIHCSEGKTDLICQDQERMDSQIAENEWLELQENKAVFMLVLTILIFFTEMRYIRIKLYSGMTTSCVTSNPFCCFSSRIRAALGNGGYTKPGFLWPEQKRLATHQPLIAPDASHGPLMFL